MDIKAVYCNHCKNIIYCRMNIHDFRTCDCGKVSIDDKGYRVIFDKLSDFENLILDGDILLELILSMDFQYGNRNVKEEFLDGYHGKFKIDKYSNEKFYNKLIKSGKEVVLTDIIKIRNGKLALKGDVSRVH